MYWNDTGLSAHCVCSNGTTLGMAAQWRTDYTVSGRDSRVVSVERRGEDSPYDYGTGVSGHLMLLSGEKGEVSRVEGGTSSKMEIRLRGVEPSSEAEICTRGAGPSSEAEIDSRATKALLRWALGPPDRSRSWALRVLGPGKIVRCFRM
jgi:hypothetical protein